MTTTTAIDVAAEERKAVAAINRRERHVAVSADVAVSAVVPVDRVDVDPAVLVDAALVDRVDHRPR